MRRRRELVAVMGRIPGAIAMAVLCLAVSVRNAAQVDEAQPPEGGTIRQLIPSGSGTLQLMSLRWGAAVNYYFESGSRRATDDGSPAGL